MKYVYKIDLPPLEEILIKDIRPHDDHMPANYMLFDDITGIIKPEYLNFLGIEWRRISYFKKSKIFGTIHTDTGHTSESYESYAINWVINSPRKMYYWHWKDVVLHGKTPTATNSSHGSAVRFKSINPPCSTYHLEPGSVYLIQTSNPHCAYGTANSKAISLRPHKYSVSWGDVVKKFNNIIIE